MTPLAVICEKNRPVTLSQSGSTLSAKQRGALHKCLYIRKLPLMPRHRRVKYTELIWPPDKRARGKRSERAE